MKKFITLFLCLTALPAGAVGLKQLAHEYIKNNKDIANQVTSVLVTQLEHKGLLISKPLTLSAQGSHTRNELEEPPLFAASPRDESDYQLSLSKGFFWGSEFSFENRLNTIDRESVAAVFIGVPGETHFFSQKLSYSQDLGRNFFGREEKLGLSLSENAIDLSQGRLNATVEKGLVDFSEKYFNLKLAKAQLALQDEAYLRAQQREQLIAKKVKDGLREKVDYYQAQINLLDQKERLEDEQNNLIRQTSFLSSLLHRKVDVKDVEAYTTTTKIFSPSLVVSLEENKDLILKRKEIEAAEVELKKSELLRLPTLQLTSSYLTNDFDFQRSQVMSHGTLGSANRQFQFVLSLTYPLDFWEENTEKIKNKIKLETIKKELEKMGKTHQIDELSLKKQLEKLEHNLTSSRKRESLARKALREYNSLYNRGRAELDQVIRAEEDLINTQRSLVRYLSDRDKFLLQLYLLYGKVLEFVESYQ